MVIKKKYIAIIIIVATIIVIMVAFDIWSSNLLNKTGIYTIGTIENIEGAKGGLMVYVSFFYLNRKYEIESINGSGDVKKSLIGKRVFIKFIPDRPTLLCSYSIYDLVPDSITSVPYAGWSQEWILEKFPKATR